MELTTDWRRQATKAAGVTALAPAVLLGAAVLLAAGAGFGGLSSLGQVAGGPSLPAVEQSTPASDDSRAEPPQTPVAALATPVPAAATSASGPGPGSGQGGGDAPQVRANAPFSRPQSPATTAPPTRNPARTPSPATPPSSGTSPGTPPQSAPITPQQPQPPQVPTTPNPIPQLLDIPRGLPAPVGPLTGGLLSTVLAPR